MTIPLFQDMAVQAASVRRFLLKAVLLLLLFIGLDRAVGFALRVGLDRYYGLNEPAVVLCVGHSHTVLGIDKVYLEQQLGVPVAKFAVEGANTADRLMMIRYYFARQPNSVRAVVYDVDAHTFTGSGLSSSSYQLLFPFIDDPQVRDYIQRNCASRTEYMLRRLLCAPRYNELTLSLAVRGYLKKWTNFKNGRVQMARLNHEISQGRFRKISFDQDNLLQFQSVAEFVGDRKVGLFLAYIPTIDVLNQAEPDKYRRSMEILNDYAQKHSGVFFLNYNADLQGRHELFFDPIHLNRDGQREFSTRLVADLRIFLSRGNVDSMNSDLPGNVNEAAMGQVRRPPGL